MKGLLVKNAFLSSPAFDALYALVFEAAAVRGVSLVPTDSASLALPLDEPLPKADFVLFWDKDIPLAERLSSGGLPVFNSPDAIRICDSKAQTALALHRAGVRAPRTVLAPLTYEGVGYPDLSFVRDACRTLGLPIVIKEAYGSFGEQVYLAYTEDEALAIAARIGARPFLLQEFIAPAFGMDIRVNVVGDKVISAMRRYGKEGDFRSNIARGGRGEAYNPTDAECALALAATRAVEADFAGVDILSGEGGEPLVCEVNASPLFVGSYRATGSNLAEHILAHIQEKI